MLILIDGKEKKFKNDVKIIVETEEGELHFTLTHEGSVIDLVKDGEVVQTVNETHEEMAYMMFSDSSGKGGVIPPERVPPGILQSEDAEADHGT